MGQRQLVWVGVALALLRCSEAEPVIMEVSRAAIIGGVVETGYPAVGMLFTGGGMMCTATLISSKVVLTAGHCVDPSDPPKWFSTGPSVDDATGTYDVFKAIQHSDFGTSWSGNIENDIGIVILKSAVPVVPMKYRSGSISSFNGQSITFVGYGVSEVGNNYSSGTKMRVTATISDITSTGFWNYTNTSNPKNTCSGDSGGPGFVTTNGVQEVVGVVSYGDKYCNQNGYNTRVDAYAPWIQGLVAQYDPTGVTPAVCGNGLCESGENASSCPADCSAGTGDLWAACDVASDCDGAICLQTDLGNFCSEYCGDPSGGTECPAGFVCVALQTPPANGDGVCYFTGATSLCGNGKCDVGEYYEICAADCIISGCGAIDDIGCCEANTLVWCVSGSLYKINCSETDCGWDSAKGYYNCQTTGGADPSGANPKSCTGGPVGPVCGNGSCESGETASGCPADCKPSKVCGNGTCETGETTSSCPADCKVVNLCGNGTCDNRENYETCAGDCVDIGCGKITDVGCCEGTVEKWCEAGKTKMIDCGPEKCGWNMQAAYYDCGMQTVEDTSGLNPRSCAVISGAECGDGTCESPETATSCPTDCQSGSGIWGDEGCEAPETTATCASDCVVVEVVCGDGKCRSPETKDNCPGDCSEVVASVCGDGKCGQDETSSSCPEDCGKVVGCGDGLCSGDEWCGDCPDDCGSCVSSSGCSAAGLPEGSGGGLWLVLVGMMTMRFIRRRRA